MSTRAADDLAVRLVSLITLAGCRIGFDGLDVDAQQADAVVDDTMLADACQFYGAAVFCDGFESGIGPQPVISKIDLDTRPAGGFDSVGVGLGFSGATQTGPATVFIDDVVVDVTPIGCVP